MFDVGTIIKSLPNMEDSDFEDLCKAVEKEKKKRKKRKNSCRKGKTGELQVAHLFKAAGYPAERGCQHDGRTGHADVVGVPYIWIEVKRDQDLNVMKAIEQAERDSSALEEEVLPVAIHRKNREQWKCTMRVLDFLTMCGVTPFSFSCPVDGLVTMVWDEWIKIYTAYEAERGM